MKEFSCEIISCENGFIVLDGCSLGTSSPYNIVRKKWIAKTPKELSELMMYLSIDATEEQKEPKFPTKDT